MEAFLLTCFKNNWIYSRWKSVFRNKFSCRTNTVHHCQNVLNIVNHSKTLRHWVCDIFPWYYVVTDRLHRETLKFLVVFHRRMRLNVDRSLGTHEVLKNSSVYLLNFLVFCTFMMSKPLGVQVLLRVGEVASEVSSTYDPHLRHQHKRHYLTSRSLTIWLGPKFKWS